MLIVHCIRIMLTPMKVLLFDPKEGRASKRQLCMYPQENYIYLYIIWAHNEYYLT